MAEYNRLVIDVLDILRQWCREAYLPPEDVMLEQDFSNPHIKRTKFFVFPYRLEPVCVEDRGGSYYITVHGKADDDPMRHAYNKCLARELRDYIRGQLKEWGYDVNYIWGLGCLQVWPPEEVSKNARAKTC